MIIIKYAGRSFSLAFLVTHPIWGIVRRIGASCSRIHEVSKAEGYGEGAKGEDKMGRGAVNLANKHSSHTYGSLLSLLGAGV